MARLPVLIVVTGIQACNPCTGCLTDVASCSVYTHAKCAEGEWVRYMNDTAVNDICITHLLLLFDTVFVCVTHAPSLELFALCLRRFINCFCIAGHCKNCALTKNYDAQSETARCLIVVREWTYASNIYFAWDSQNPFCRLKDHEHPAAGDGVWGSQQEVPSFLYAMPLQPGRVFLEETCLVTKPALPFAVLKRRLERRLKAMGIKVTILQSHFAGHYSYKFVLPSSLQLLWHAGLELPCFVHCKP